MDGHTSGAVFRVFDISQKLPLPWPAVSVVLDWVFRVGTQGRWMPYIALAAKAQHLV